MAVTVPAQIVLGLAVAVLLDAQHAGARPLPRRSTTCPVVTSWVVVSLLFRYLFITDGGLVNGHPRRAPSPVTTSTGSAQRWTAMLALSILGIWKGIGWAMVIFLAALQGVPRELQRSGRRRRRQGVGALPRRLPSGDPSRRSPS